MLFGVRYMNKNIFLEKDNIEYLTIPDWEAKKKKNKIIKYLIIFTICFTIVFLLVFLYYIFVIGKIDFKLVGNENVEVNVFDEYHDEGVIAKHCTIVKCKKINKFVNINNNINNKKLGSYKVINTLKYQNRKRKLVRNVKVVDKVLPEISLNGNNKAIVCPGKTYVEEGYKATDNYDGDITSNVVVSTNDNFVSYSVKDSSGNSNQINRNLVFEDKDRPIISLKGNTNIYIEFGGSYKEFGYSATDKCDGDISSSVKVTNNVNTKKLGVYYVNYEVTDKAGNKNSTTRKVIVHGIDKTNASTYTSSLTSYIKSKGYKVSIGYYNLNSGYKYTYNPSGVYYGASLIKTLDALYLYEKEASGQLDLNSKITFEQKHKRDYSAGMQKYKVGNQVSLRELIKYDITVSDNTAHAMLIDYIGFNNLKSYGNSLGARYTLVGKDNFGQTVVDDQIAYMKKLYKFTNNSSNGQELRNFFVNNYYNYISFNGMPTFAHKYGHQGIVFHDVGIVLDSKPYIIVILSNGTYVNRKDIFQDISKKIYEFHKLFS